jgi:hypothetical protein
MLKSSLVAAALILSLGSQTAFAGETPPANSRSDEADGFRVERSYYTPGQAPVSHGVRGLIRSLERARGMRTVSSTGLGRDYSLDAAL